jgi:hypothetical protein
MEFIMKKIIVDKNHPLFKCIDLFTKKYDFNSLILIVILGFGLFYLLKLFIGF